MHRKTLMELSRALSHKEVSSVELTRHFLERIKQYDLQLNTFISVSEEHALQQAAAADQAISQGTATPLTGIPIAQKDIFCTKDIKTTCASKILSQFVPPYNATLIEKSNHGGMILLGKTNMDEFAMGSSNENSYYGAVKNPWDMSCTPGGSSGGSAAAVAARLTPVATGTDTGGSIRQPAALCGVTGLKPTYGRISRFGMIAFASSLDQAGALTQTAEDAALIMNLLAGHDPKDSTSINHPVPDYLSKLDEGIHRIKIGLPKEYFENEIDTSVQSSINAAIKIFQSLGAEIVDISLPHTEFATSAYYVIAPAEASSNLARFDGIRYGYRCQDPLNLEDLYKRSREEGFGAEVKRRILIGTYVLSSGYYEAYYQKAQKIRRQICDDFKQAFEKVDVILTPTTPAPAFKLGEKSKDPVAMYLSDIFTIAVNLSGLPALSFPAGFSKQPLPIGIQLIGNSFQEARLLQLGHQFQKLTDWHGQIPHQFES